MNLPQIAGLRPGTLYDAVQLAERAELVKPGG